MSLTFTMPYSLKPPSMALSITDENIRTFSLKISALDRHRRRSNLSYTTEISGPATCINWSISNRHLSTRTCSYGWSFARQNRRAEGALSPPNLALYAPELAEMTSWRFKLIAN